MSLFGNGSDGNFNISTAFDINSDTSGSRSYADGIAYQVTTNPTTNIIDLEATPNGIIMGDRVLLINMQGISSDYSDVGNCELFNVVAVIGTSLVVDRAPSKSYDGSSFSNQKVVIQRVPQYNNASLSSTAQLSSYGWDGLSSGMAGSAGRYTGIVAICVSDTLTIGASAMINVGADGYRYGDGGAVGNNPGYQGESYTGVGVIETDANAGAGGGADHADLDGGGGGGAGYGTAGSAGQQFGTSTAGQGGITYGSDDLANIYLGSGGGGGSGDAEGGGDHGGPGGDGGGIVILLANNIQMDGWIRSNGASGQLAYGGNCGGGGGGGAGGSIYLFTNSVTFGDTNRIQAVAGAGAYDNYDGGAGGNGRIRLDYSTLDAVSYPNDAGANDACNLDPYTSPTISGLFETPLDVSVSVSPDTNHAIYDNPFYNASSDGLEIYDTDISTQFAVAYVTYAGGINSIALRNDTLYMATSNSGIWALPTATVTGTNVYEPDDLSSYIYQFKDYPEITDSHIKYLHTSGDYLCVVTASGVDHFNLGNSDSYTRSSGLVAAEKCFQTCRGCFYYTSGTKIVTIYAYQCDWNEVTVGYEYDSTVSGTLLPADGIIRDIFVVEDTYNNLIFAATSSGVALIEERPGNEPNSNYKQYMTGGLLKGTAQDFRAIWAETDSTFDSPSFATVSYGSDGGLNVVRNDALVSFWPSTASGTGNTIREDVSDLVSVR